MEDRLAQYAQNVADRLSPAGLTLAVAESCTGGWLAKTLTDIAGSSAWFERGLVTYSNAAKMELVGVKQNTLDCHGAVSKETVREMAEGTLSRSNADIAVAISGIAGPGGGTADKPVGTVWLAWSRIGCGIRTECTLFEGDRKQVREQAVAAALKGLLSLDLVS